MNYVIDKKTIINDVIVKSDNGFNIYIYIEPTAIFNIVGTMMDWEGTMTYHKNLLLQTRNRKVIVDAKKVLIYE